MPAMTERVEFYKARGQTLEVSTCDCCLYEGFQDAWEYTRKGYHSVGVRWSSLKAHYTLITEKEARQRVTKLGYKLMCDRHL
jgi:hypothetical protein